MRMLLSVICLAGALAACTGPQVVQETPPGVSFRVDRASASDANVRADQYCQRYGKRARLLTVQPTSSGESIANYQCA
jgi:hypothetical protein